MDTGHLVEALLSGVIYSDEAGEAYPELDRLREWVGGSALLTPGGSTRFTPGDAGKPIPLQYALCTLDLPAARGVICHAARSLLALLDAAAVTWDTDSLDGCGKFRALLAAPDWLLRPAEPDNHDFDVALLLERELGGQGWPGLLEALHQAGSVSWQPAIRRCREMMRFEAEQGVDLAKLVGVRVSPGEGLVTEVTARSAVAPQTLAP